jgi:hypothetical protein
MAGTFELLRKIRVKPGMFIGRASAHDLFIFLEGYQTARRELGIELTPAELEFYDEFQPWLQKRMKISTNNSWAAMIQLQCVNEKEAFEEFFELLEEFWQRPKGEEAADDAVSEVEAETMQI